jgi:hypothetical protein
MPKPKRPASNRARDRRIEQEVVVDVCTSEERAIGWYYCVKKTLKVPLLMWQFTRLEG